MVAHSWWKHGVVYQIWPASYKDSNGDGIGDIQGIISTLDYLQDLGVDIIWLSPIYQSPQIDMGYDISDYQKIHAPFGTLEDVSRLIEECHKRELRIIFDLVINHTSYLHQWFQESRESKGNDKRDWYIWRPAQYNAQGHRRPPNNWRSSHGGSVWEWDQKTEEYYLHLFEVEQPDLNWENEKMRKAIYETAINFWLRKGVDGFRIDTVNMYSKGSLSNVPVIDEAVEWQLAHTAFCNGPRIHEFLSEMNAIFSQHDIMTVGELAHTHIKDEILLYVGAKAKQLNMAFDFHVCNLGKDVVDEYQPQPIALTDFKAAISRSQGVVEDTDAWTTVFLENHDQCRSISRFGSDNPAHRAASGKMLALLLTSLTGTLFIYQGQEIGMVNIPSSWSIEEYKDIGSKLYYDMIKKGTNGDPAALKAALYGIQSLSRDNARTPVQWDSSAHSGFSTGTPWMRVNDSYSAINVQRQQEEPNSLLAFWKAMIVMRRRNRDLFVYGRFEILDKDNEAIFTYRKTFEDQRALVVLNFTKEPQEFQGPVEFGEKNMKLLQGTVDEALNTKLAPFEGRIYLAT